MPIIEETIAWAKVELPVWQEEAVRRLLTQEVLTVEDCNELYKLFKRGGGLLDAGEDVPEPPALRGEDIVGTRRKSEDVVLKRVQDIRNVNAIPDGSELLFANAGLTVVYGENGTGKSGYARMLKKACFARDDKEKIHGNIFRAGIGGIAQSTFKVRVAGQDLCVDWRDGEKKSELLLNICVFDSRCARVILDSKNAIVYLPYGGEVFSKLVGLIQEFKTRIEAEKPKAIKPEISGLGRDTKAGTVFEGLNAATEEDTLVDWFTWPESREAGGCPIHSWRLVGYSCCS